MKKVINIVLALSLVVLSMGASAASSGESTWVIDGDKVYIVYSDGTKVLATGGVCKTS